MQQIVRPEIWAKRIAAAALPDIWRMFDQARTAALGRGKTWPGYMWMPLEEVAAEIMRALAALMASRHASAETISYIMPFAAANAYTLATWRLGKGVYRFDDDLRVALLDTPVTGEIPTEVLKRLPEWCVYVETPGYRCADRQVYGFFVCTTRFAGEDVLYLSIDLTDPEKSRVVSFIPIGLGRGTIEEALLSNAKRSIAITNEMKRQGVPVSDWSAKAMAAIERDPAKLQESVDGVLADVGPLLSLALYLCAENRELDPEPPPRPAESHTKGGPRFFAASSARLVSVGMRLGARLREARAHTGGDRREATGTVVPHLRRAHWHTYLYGARAGPRERRLRWLHPTLVNEHARADDAPAVLHPVEAPFRNSIDPNGDIGTT
jgi:hypothetical protein